MKLRGHRTQGARWPAEGHQEGPEQSYSHRAKPTPRSPAGAQVLTSQTMQELGKKLRKQVQQATAGKEVN